MIHDAMILVSISHWLSSWNNEVWNGNSESSAICQYVCQSVLFVQPIRSFNLISMLVHCLHMKITTCLLVLINQLRKWDNSFSCELVSSLSAYESCLIYLEQSCHSILSSSMLDTHVERDLSLFKGGKELIGYFGVQILTFTALRTAPQSQVLRLFNLFHLGAAEMNIIRIFL